MPIDSNHPEYDKFKPIWDKNADAVAGQDQIKAGSTKYLPQLPGQSEPDYKSYLYRASYDNWPGRVLTTSLGQLFRKRPTGYDDKKIVDLNGNNLERFSRRVAREIISKYRCCVILDYSLELGSPYLTWFSADQVTNWRAGSVGGERALEMVVIAGRKMVPASDRYKPEYIDTRKEYYIDDRGFYQVRNFEKNDNGEFIQTSKDAEKPLLQNDKPMTKLPVYFLTPDGLSDELHNPPITDIVNGTLAHYHNSADYENMLHITGAKTLLTHGYGDKVFPIGGRAEFPPVSDAGAKYLEASSDSGLKDAMSDKREILAGMGGQYISGRGRYVASAETSRNQGEGEFSTLADLANSLSTSFTQIMSDFEEWETGERPELSIEFNTDYESGEIQSGIITELINGNASHAFGRKTLFWNLKKREIFPHGTTFEDNEQEVEAERRKAKEEQAAATKAALEQDYGLGDGPRSEEQNLDEDQMNDE